MLPEHGKISEFKKINPCQISDKFELRLPRVRTPLISVFLFFLLEDHMIYDQSLTYNQNVLHISKYMS